MVWVPQQTTPLPSYVAVRRYACRVAVGFRPRHRWPCVPDPLGLRWSPLTPQGVHPLLNLLHLSAMTVL
jgi:hypothetical protein